MTPERQREVIAEWCGWKKGNCGWWEGPQGQETPYLPDYINDLNAMREVVERLTDDQRVEFCIRLNEVVRRGKAVGDGIRTFENIQAKAYQRTEALIRTIGKWED